MENYIVFGYIRLFWELFRNKSNFRSHDKMNKIVNATAFGGFFLKTYSPRHMLIILAQRWVDMSGKISLCPAKYLPWCNALLESTLN